MVLDIILVCNCRQTSKLSLPIDYGYNPGYYGLGRLGAYCTLESIKWLLLSITSASQEITHSSGEHSQQLLRDFSIHIKNLSSINESSSYLA